MVTTLLCRARISYDKDSDYNDYLINKNSKCQSCLNNKYYLDDRKNNKYRLLKDNTHAIRVMDFENIDLSKYNLSNSKLSSQAMIKLGTYTNKYFKILKALLLSEA